MHVFFNSVKINLSHVLFNSQDTNSNLMRTSLIGQIPKEYSWNKEEITEYQKDCPLFFFVIHTVGVFCPIRYHIKFLPFFQKGEKESNKK